jgi:choline kinase
MKAVILAAGKGSRLNGIIGDAPKCLLKVGEMSLIERQIMMLRHFGIDDIVVVVGYNADLVKSVIGRSVQFIENDIYARTNSLYSLWLSRDILGDGFVVMNGDVLFHPRMLRNLLHSNHEDALLISYRTAITTGYGDEEMKVKIDSGKIVDISKQIAPAEADGENVGVGKFGLTGAQLLIEKMNDLIGRGAERDWAPRAFQDFARERSLYPVNTGGYPWIEIDFPEDYHRAINSILPQILRSTDSNRMRGPATENRVFAENII